MSVDKRQNFVQYQSNGSFEQFNIKLKYMDK